VIPDIQGNNSSSSPGVTPGQTVVIALAMCAALVIGTVVFRRALRVRSTSSTGSVSSGSADSSSESADSSSESADSSSESGGASGSVTSFV
jgi:cytoskeletal protein RodZ